MPCRLEEHMKLTLAIAVYVLSLGMPSAHARPALPGGPAGALQVAAPDATEVLVRARTVSVIGNTGKQMQNRLWANPDGDRGKRKVESCLTPILSLARLSP
jgi:hypothetical protein